MDRPISNTKKKRRRGKNALRITGLIAVLVGALFILRSMLTKELDRKDFQTATVEVGKVEEAITASGLVVPAFEQQLTAPVTAAIQEVHRQSGDKVERGDTILQLDEEYIRLQYESLADQLELKKNKITRLRHEYDKNIQDLAYESEIKALQISSLEAQLADTKRLREIGSATPEEVDQAQLQLDIARLEKQKLDNELRFREQVLPGDRRNLELVIPDQPIRFEIDEEQIEQALVNMVKNALESLGGGGTIKLMSTAHPAQIVVADNGPGLPPGAEQEWMSPFFSTKPEGQGIGLTLIKEIARQHGGRCELETLPNGWTECRIRLN